MIERETSSLPAVPIAPRPADLDDGLTDPTQLS